MEPTEEQKERRRASSRRYRQKHPEKMAAIRKAWRDAHREEKRASDLAYSRLHAEKNSESAKRWAKANPEKMNARAARYYAANPELFRERSSAWKRANPVKANAQNQQRNARKRNATSPLCKVTAAAIAERFALTDGCAYCGADEKLTLDHVVALNDGGLHVPSNLVGACSTCNSSKQDKPVEAWFRAQPFFSEQRWQRIQEITGQGQLSLI
jgi:5-methylcytosine-specific restriction endonuclease McrA